MPYLQHAGLLAADSDQTSRRSVEDVVRAAGDRIKLAGDILEFSDFFIADAELQFDTTAFDKRLRSDETAVILLKKFRSILAALEPFDAASTEQSLKAFVEAEGIKFNQIIHPLRVAVTGKPVGFGMFDALAILGKARCLARIDRALESM